jgi:uncharacterized membrane protein
MVTTAIDPHSVRTRWLRRSAAAAIATVVLGITGTGLAVGIVSARQAANSGGGTQASSSDDSSSSDSGSSTGSGSGSGSSSDSGSSGLGSAQQGAPAQGGSNGS